MNIRGQYMIAGNILGIAKINPQIPFRQDVAPLGADAAENSVRGCREIVAVDAGEQAQRGMLDRKSVV